MKKIRNSYKAIFLLLSAFVFYLTACQNESSKQESTSASDNEEKKTSSETYLLTRGKYLVSISGCNDCHSPKIMTPQGPMVDTTKPLSGHPANSPLPPLPANAAKPGDWILMAPDLTAFVGPWGISYTANLTSDSATGLGAWTADVFIKTMRTGKHLGQEGGRQILPPMPWYELANMTDEDLKAVFTFLQSVPAVTNRVPAPVPPTELGKPVK